AGFQQHQEGAHRRVLRDEGNPAGVARADVWVRRRVLRRSVSGATERDASPTPCVRHPFPPSQRSGAAVANPRVRKVADRIQVVVAEMLERRIKDPRLGFVTVTDVRVSGDTQQATVFYTVLGEDKDLEGTAVALASAKGLIRSEVAKQLGMRHAPTLEFIHDALPDTARHIDEVLERAKALDEEVASQRGTSYAGEADPYKK